MKTAPTARYHSLFPRPLAECVERLAKPVFKKNGLVEMRLIREWELIIGPRLAQCSAPVKLSFPAGKREGGTLTIAAEKGCELDLHYQIPLLIEKLAIYFGYKAVTRVKLTQLESMPVPSAHVQFQSPASLPDMPNDALECALQRLQHALHG